jgi:hypothetical protein
MNKSFSVILRSARAIYRKFAPHAPVVHSPFPLDYTGQEASALVYELLLENKPCMIARLGSQELDCVLIYLSMTSNKKTSLKLYDYITNKNNAFWWTDECKKGMCQNAGFFPGTEDSLCKFSELMLGCTKNLDVLGSWYYKEKLIQDRLNNVKIISYRDLQPYYHNDPWSKYLEDKKVLVIHPYAESITLQYDRHEKLFANRSVLPNFQLETIAAVQSIANRKVDYKTWFDALDAMENQITKKDYDVAIIGCGAYGFPLASFVKDQGKQAIHLGGSVQLLFGIKGYRWDNDPYVSSLYNEYWIRPSAKETPEGFSKVENGCYW